MASMNQDLIWKFLPDSIIYVSGQTGAGKSTFLLSLLADNAAMLSGSAEFPPNIIYCYGMHSEMVHKLSKSPLNIKLIQGLDKTLLDHPEDFFSPRAEGTPKDVLQNLIVFDDLAISTANSASFTRLLTEAVHHRSVSCIVATHSWFFEGKFRRLQMSQASYFVSFKSPRSMDSVCRLAQQLSLVSRKAAKAAFQHISMLEYTPLIMDAHKDTPPQLTLLSGILPHQYPITVYQCDD